MNILIPHNWLLEHLETNETPEAIQSAVSLCGPSIERIYDKEGEKVYDIEVTTNRVDAMSVRGIAREIAVILKHFNMTGALKKNTLPRAVASTTVQLPLPKISNDSSLSKRLTCIVLAGVERTPTPEWMAKRLLQTDQNIHDSAIDITNYITHELGHPCHAFDYDKVMNKGGEILVTTAKKGETFTTLDGNTFTTVGGEVVFKNGAGEIIDLPSIKGTANTSIDNSTKNILLLLESIRAEKVRFASMTHAIRTTAAQLMEKNVDPHLAEQVLLRGVQLYQELCHATVASEIYDDFPGSQSLPSISVPLQTIKKYLGISIETETIISILEEIECIVTEQKDTQSIVVQPPTFRPDLTIPADIVEEIARIYGYHNLPSILMDTQIPTKRQEGVNFSIETKIKRFLASIGLQEIYSYSMVSKEIATQTDALEAHLQLQNPLTDDRIYLRKSLIPSLVEVLQQNSQVQQLSLFEIANVYIPQEAGLPKEKLHLTIVSNQGSRETTGMLESLLDQFFVENISIAQTENTSATIKTVHNLEEITLGNIQMLADGVVAIELSFTQLLRVFKTHPTYQPAPKTAVITEDMTFTLPVKTQVGSVLQTIKELSSDITKVTLKSHYEQNFSFTMRYNDPSKNLTSTDIEPLRKHIAQTLLAKHQAVLVGTV